MCVGWRGGSREEGKQQRQSDRKKKRVKMRARMLYGTVQYTNSSMRYVTVESSPVQYNTVQHSKVLYSTVLCSIVQLSTVRHNTVLYSAALCDVTRTVLQVYRILPALRMLILRLVMTRATAKPSGTLCTARDREMNWPERRGRGENGGYGERGGGEGGERKGGGGGEIGREDRDEEGRSVRGGGGKRQRQ